MNFQTQLEEYAKHLRQELVRTGNRQAAMSAIWQERNDLLGQYTPAGDEKLSAVWRVEKEAIKEVLG